MCKKYALILYGELRTYKKASIFLKKNLLDINNIDIFISTHHGDKLSSHNIDINADTNNDLFDNYYGNYLKGISYIEDNDLNELFSIIRTKIKIIDSELYKKFESELSKMNTFHDWSIIYKKMFNKNNKGFYFKNKENYQYVLHEIIQLYHRLNAFRMLEIYSKENIKYDGVIIYRPDLYFAVPLDLSTLNLNDQTIYFRLDFLIISSFNGIKKCVTKILDDYYCDKNIKYIQSLPDDQKLYRNISEIQHNMFLWNKEYYLHSFDILNYLIHYRATKNEKDDCLWGQIQDKENKGIKYDLNAIISQCKDKLNNILKDNNPKLNIL